MAGRIKGGKNQKTEMFHSFAKYMIRTGQKKFEQEMGKLTGRDYCQMFMDLFEYCAPKLQRTDIN